MNNTLKHKLVLLITQAFSITIDLVLLISLAVKGYSFLRYIMLIVLLVFEAIYLTTSFFTNYRFSYSTKVLIFHNIFTVACVALQFVSNKGNISAKLMTNYAILTFLVVHSAALLAIDLSAYVASRNTLFKVNKTASVFALIISIPALAFSVFFTFKEGFFGQGYGDRAVIYSYNEASDSYTAVGIAEGFGNRATIKKTFNNRPVDQINLSVFCYPSIKVLSIEERPNLDFVGFEKGFAVNTNTEVQTTNEFSKTIRKKLVDIALKENHTSAIDAANQVVPNDLKDNEYYVSFKLTKELLDITNGEYIDTIVVNGDTKLTNDIFPPLLKFIKYSDHLSDADLYWNYTNNNKKIFKSMKDSSGNDILGKSINKNYYNVEISFDDIYKIFINNDNDTKYEPSNEEKYIDVSGSLYRYKLTTYENAENILNSIKPRDGFSLEFSCNGTKFTSLKDLIISSSTNELSIDPVWSISFPSITNITCNHPNFTGIYGDDFSVTTAVAGSNRANYKFSYKYTFTGVTKVESSNPTLTLNNMYPVQSGSYYVAVTVYSDTETSLTKTISQSFTITVNKKPIDKICKSCKSNKIKLNRKKTKSNNEIEFGMDDEDHKDSRKHKVKFKCVQNY